MNLADLKTPGVYINEIPTLPSSIVGVETAIPAFIGYTEKFMLNGKNQFDGGGTYTPKESLRISSAKEYIDNFGGPKPGEATFTVSVKDKVRKIAVADITKEVLDARSITVKTGANVKFLMYYQVQMYFANGGGPCYIVPAGPYSASPGKAKMLDALNEVVAKLDEPTLLIFPDGTSLSKNDLYTSVYTAALQQCEELKDRFVIMDLVPGANNAQTISDFRGDDDSAGIGTNNLKYGAAYHPWLKSNFSAVYADEDVAIEHKRDYRDETATPPTDAADQDVPGAAADLKALGAATALYAQIKVVVDNERLTLPPSGAMAGIYAATDNARGVWKAPANVSVSETIGLTVTYTDQEQEELNVDATGGKSINIIRSFTGRGIIVWGARTLDGNSLEWRYVNVRRFFNYVEESVKKGMTRYVFEPNDANTWVTVRATIENFLRLQWQAGALQGTKPEHAYFVRVGLGQTMTAEDVLEGRLIIQIGMAVVRPAEFIVLNFMHQLAQS
jgi:uncharacterized protein